MTLKIDGWPWKTIGHLFYTLSSFVHHFKSIGEVKLELQSGNAQFGSKLAIFLSRVTLKFHGWPRQTIGIPLLCYIKLCVAFPSYWYIQTGVTVRKRSIRVKIGDFLSHVTLKLDGWPWKTIGHLFCTTLSFVQHFEAIAIFKLELQSGNAQIRSKSTIFFSRVTLKFDRWPWKTIGHLFYATSSSVHHSIAICELKLELQSGNS